ncbi:MAG: radical SAM protein, partial [Candidatus Geothermincolia bacterium]
SHLHLPLQSGATPVLKAMGRAYTAEEFLDRVKEIRSHSPEIAITSDIMVGFPGETERDHQDSLSLVSELGLSRLHIFKYSRRPGTRAYDLGDPVSGEIKQRRADEMREVASAGAARFHAGLVGRIIQVLVEGAINSEPGCYFGRAESFSGAMFEGSEDLVGERVWLRVTSSGAEGVRGQLVDVEGAEDGEESRGR